MEQDLPLAATTDDVNRDQCEHTLETSATAGPDDRDNVSLAAFRMMCLSNPLLEVFFSTHLPASFQLEAPHRASFNGTSIWHDIPTPMSTLMTSGQSSIPETLRTAPHQTASAPAITTTFSSAFPSSPSGSSTSKFPPSASYSSSSSSSTRVTRAYSKDVSTGVVGRLGGFLNNLLGEDVKSKVDDLADQLGEKLNTKAIRGPLPSFAFQDDLAPSSALLRKKGSSAVLGMDDLRALEDQRRERRIRRVEEEQFEEEQIAAAAAAKTKNRGMDITAAQESLRLATEAIVEGKQTSGKQFGDEEPTLAENGREEDEEDVVVVDDDVVELSK